MSTDLQPGALFGDRYRVLRRIAAGGMGAVYEVLHVETDRRRALKVMLPHVLDNEDLRERFKREAKVAARIESEHIVEVFDAGVDAATEMPFLVMELLRGEELGKRLKRLGPMPPGEVAEYLRQTALALDKTHAASVIHRDLKPANLFLCERDDGPPRVKVLDFGVAKIVAESASSGGLTESVGTPFYMAPEQLNPSATLGPAADIYALGMVAYTLLVGSPYWAEEGKAGIFALATTAVSGPKEPASTRAARRGVTLPATFDAWFARMTAPQPAQRFARASEATQALAYALGVTGTASVTPQAGGASAPPPFDRHARAVVGKTTASSVTTVIMPQRRSVGAPAVIAAGVACGVVLLLAAHFALRGGTAGAAPAEAAPSTAAAVPTPAEPIVNVGPALGVDVAPSAPASAAAPVARASAAPGLARPAVRPGARTPENKLFQRD